VALVVESPGVWTTIQDRGRAGYRGWGVAPGGAFDLESHDLANALLGNEEDAATLELTLMGGVYRAEITLAIALVGAPMGAAAHRQDGTRQALRVPQTLTLEPGDRLALSGTASGARTYLAVRGGWKTPLILGSRSSDTPLKSGDRLAAEAGGVSERRPAQWRLPDPEVGPLRVVDGPDSPESDFWEGRAFRVGTRSNRIGLRLDGEPLTVGSNPERLSAPVAFGTVQLAGSQLIILGPSSGTMGGYPHLADVISPDLNRLGQARPGSRLTYQSIRVEDARKLDREHRQRWSEYRRLISCFARAAT
jgi:biotin-dependent carboxylase-like uncharacterized protein